MTDVTKGNGSTKLQERTPGHLLAWPEELERYFDAQWKNWPFRPFRLTRRPAAATWLPQMDVFERDGTFVVRTDLPGMTAENIDVSVEDDVLTIKGHREEEKEVKEDDYYFSERATGEFVRSIRLPDGVNGDALEAHYDKGVLEVTVPKPHKAAPKAVKVDVK